MRTRTLFSKPPRVRSLLLAAGATVALVGCQQDQQSPTAPESTPALATTTTALSFRQVSAGFYHTCGVTTDNRAYCWGWNPYGQLGDGTTTKRTRPVLVSGGHLFRQVSAGDTRSCGVTTTNRLYCWGYNANGVLGDGTTTDRLLPVLIAGGLRFRQVDVNRYQGYHTCAVTTEYRGYCWGTNYYGQIGDGTTTERMTPVAVAGTRLFREVSVGYFYTCGVTTGQRAYCWGYNGDGSGLPRSTPTAITGGLSFSQVNAGSVHTCGVSSGNRAYCWGDNPYGALGDGTKRNFHLTPVAVAGGLSFGSVRAGGLHTCGITPSAAAYCWGWNGFGQLGDFTRTNRFTPQAVVGPM